MRAVRDVRAVPNLSGGRIDLTWRNPPAEDFAPGAPLAAVRIVRRERTFPLDPDDGDLVYEGPAVSSFPDVRARPLTTYYYTVFTVTAGSPPALTADEGSRAAGFATTAEYRLGDALYRMLPAVHRRLDRPLTAVDLGGEPSLAGALDRLPDGLRDRGQLYRFLSVAGSALDLTRSLAEGLAHLHDPDTARPEFLPALARMVGWDLNRTAPVSVRRNEIAAAPYLYRGVGTVPGLRAIVNRYTGWYVQVAEMAQSIARSNSAPEYHVFAVADRTQGWRGSDDAGPLLGFGSGASAAGSTGTPAKLTGETAAPFALRPGTHITVTADDRVPTKVVFAPGDFADITAATAEEVASVLSRTLSEVTAVADASGKLVLTSNMAGAGSAVRVEESLADLVTLEGAPGGRLSVFGSDRPRLCYGTMEVPGGPGGIRMKTFRQGFWGESLILPTGSEPSGDPTGAEVPAAGGKFLVAWVDRPGAADSRLRYAEASPRQPGPAVLRSGHAGRYAIRPGTRLTVRSGRYRQSARLTADDFVNPRLATAAEVAAALAGKLPGIRVTGTADRALELATPAAGGDQRLDIELDASDAAEALGFDPSNASATGTWGDDLDWSVPGDVTAAAPGRVAEPFAVAEGPGRVRLFWSAHEDGRWGIRTALRDGTTWGAPYGFPSDGGGDREPSAIVVPGAAGDRLWLFWSRRQGTGTIDNVWTLMYRVLDLGTGVWEPEQTVITALAAPDSSADREPMPVLLPGGDLRVYFSSDRPGGSGVWFFDLSPAGSLRAAPVPVLTGPARDRTPVPVRVVGKQTHWLLFRSDRGVALSGLATRPLPSTVDRVTSPLTPPPPGTAPLTSVRSPDTGTLRRYAGSTTVTRSAADRNGRRRQWDDMLAYTPCKPRGAEFGEFLENEELYTRGTLALFLSPLVPDNALSAQLEEQVRPLLEKFRPIGTRAVLVFAPRTTTEYVYSPGHDIRESYDDDYPYVEFVTGPDETTGAALPDWVTLLATKAGHTSVRPDDLTTFRRRTWYPPPS
ncbi:phage tail protein [Streptomyces sp. NPDC051018]|uniref:phage tail protein n=1 Tax=Streptomyces sp. NPDC051018 TaxID=3365639 RepID=UPI0037B0B6BE